MNANGQMRAAGNPPAVQAAPVQAAPVQATPVQATPAAPAQAATPPVQGFD
jgi:hypothetical protein